MKSSLTLAWGVVAALTVPFLAGCSGNETGQAPMVRANDNALVYMSSANGNNEVWAMNTDGSGKVLLASTPSGEAIQGALSPDGHKVLFVSQLVGTGSQVVEQDLQTGERTVLYTDSDTTGNDFAPTYSGTGMIAYHDDSDGIHVMNVDGTDNQLISNDSDDHTPSWNATGTRIVFDRGWNGSICTMNPDGSDLVVVKADDGAYSYGQPKFLPDGRIICMRNGDSKDIVVMDADGSNEINLTPGTDTTDEFFPTVNSTGTKVAFATNRNEGQDIYVGTLSGSAITDLVNVTEDVSYNCWRPSFGVLDRSYLVLN